MPLVMANEQGKRFNTKREGRKLLFLDAV